MKPTKVEKLLSNQFLLSERVRNSENWSYDDDVIYSTMQHYKKPTLQPATIPAYSLEIGQDDRQAPEKGTRTIGQVAGHEINLEKEDVLDKKNSN